MTAAEPTKPTFSLQLPGWTVLDVRVGAPVVVHVRPAGDVVPVCATAGCALGRMLRFGTLSSSAVCAPVAGAPVGLDIVQRRYMCAACRATALQPAPELVEGARITRRLLAYLQDQLHRVPVSVIAHELDLPVTTLDTINAVIAGARDGIVPDAAPAFPPLGWADARRLAVCGLCLRRHDRATARVARVHLFAVRPTRTIDALVCPTCVAGGSPLWLKPRN